MARAQHCDRVVKEQQLNLLEQEQLHALFWTVHLYLCVLNHIREEVAIHLVLLLLQRPISVKVTERNSNYQAV